MTLPADDQRRRVPKSTRAFVFLRSFFIYLGFNPKTLQGPGFAFAIQPALRSLYGGDALTDATRRYLQLFNTNAYMSAALVGSAIRWEERVASGLATAEEADAFRVGLGPPLAAIGDAFFWTALRPACALTAILLVPLIGVWALAVFLGFYNVVHLRLRVWLFRTGYRAPDELISNLGRLRIPQWTQRLRRLAAVLAGAVAAELIFVSGMRGPKALLLSIGVAAVALVLATRVRPGVLVYGALAIALVAALFF